MCVAAHFLTSTVLWASAEEVRINVFEKFHTLAGILDENELPCSIWSPAELKKSSTSKQTTASVCGVPFTKKAVSFFLGKSCHVLFYVHVSASMLQKFLFI